MSVVLLIIIPFVCHNSCSVLRPCHYRWTRLAQNVSATVSAVLGSNIPFQGAAFAESSHSTTGFSPQAIIADGILNSQPGSQITSYVICQPSICIRRIASSQQSTLSSPSCSPCARHDTHLNYYCSHRISQHHYSGSFCSGSNGVLQDLMTKSTIRSNLTQF